MKSPDHYHRRAAECRRDALGLAIFAAACAAALLLIGYGCAGGPFHWVPLALLSGIFVAGAGALNEVMDARQLRRRAMMEETYQPAERI